VIGNLFKPLSGDFLHDRLVFLDYMTSSADTASSVYLVEMALHLFSTLQTALPVSHRFHLASRRQAACRNARKEIAAERGQPHRPATDHAACADAGRAAASRPTSMHTYNVEYNY
jgi:hypothetical protein